MSIDGREWAPLVLVNNSGSLWIVDERAGSGSGLLLWRPNLGQDTISSSTEGWIWGVLKWTDNWYCRLNADGGELAVYSACREKREKRFPRWLPENYLCQSDTHTHLCVCVCRGPISYNAPIVINGPLEEAGRPMAHSDKEKRIVVPVPGSRVKLNHFTGEWVGEVYFPVIFLHCVIVIVW